MLPLAVVAAWRWSARATDPGTCGLRERGCGDPQYASMPLACVHGPGDYTEEFYEFNDK
jgi:hypothetical protein